MLSEFTNECADSFVYSIVNGDDLQAEIPAFITRTGANSWSAAPLESDRGNYNIRAMVCWEMYPDICYFGDVVQVFKVAFSCTPTITDNTSGVFSDITTTWYSTVEEDVSALLTANVEHDCVGDTTIKYTAKMVQPGDGGDITLDLPDTISFDEDN